MRQSVRGGLIVSVVAATLAGSGCSVVDIEHREGPRAVTEGAESGRNAAIAYMDVRNSGSDSNIAGMTYFMLSACMPDGATFSMDLDTIAGFDREQYDQGVSEAERGLNLSYDCEDVLEGVIAPIIAYGEIPD